MTDLKAQDSLVVPGQDQPSAPGWTPSPWTIIPARPYDGDDEDLEGSFYAAAAIEGSDGNPVCVFGDAAGSAVMFENEADYHLIAAAPDLYEALDYVLSASGEQLTDAFEQAHRALASARGDRP